VWVTFGATVVRDVGGSTLRSIQQLVDISDRVAAARELVRLNAELREANDQLAAMNTELDRFAAAVAHDLKSPLTAILMHAELLKESLGAHSGSRGARSISHAARRLNGLIEGLLLYARAQGAELHRQEVDLDTVVDDVAAELAVATGRPVRVTRDDLPSLFLEPTMFRQVVSNVIDNGLKYVRAGESPHVHVSAERDDSTGTWTLRFVDRGIGISPTAREQVFEVFHRETSDYPGTGIGLATCRRIVERHGGRIWIEGHAAGGTVVSVQLPAGSAG
jgi:signal transduction histidine kinase